MSTDFCRSVLSIFVVALLQGVGGVIYSDESCSDICTTPRDFIDELPLENGHVLDTDNRAYAWSVIALIQIRLNIADLSPPGSARICGIVGTCLYEAAALNTPRFESSTGHNLQLLPSGNAGLLKYAIDGAAYWALRSIFGEKESFGRVLEQFEEFADQSLEELVPTVEYAASIEPKDLQYFAGTWNRRAFATAAGASACKSVLEQRTKDGFLPDGTLGNAPDPTGYEPVNSAQTVAGVTNCEAEIADLDRWQPLCVPEGNAGFGTEDCTPQTFLAPWAGRYTPFALGPGDETTGDELVGPPPFVGSPASREQWKEVLKFSANLDDVGKITAELWADGPDSTAPPGHWWKIAADAALAEDLSVAETARLLFIVGNAVNDAGIASWRTKTTYDFVRPLQLIQCGDLRGENALAWSGPYLGVGLVPINEWRPYQAADFVTPPFAGYTSGHSTFSAAAATALKLYFGGDAYKGPQCFVTPEGESLFEPKSDEFPGFSDIPNSGPDTVGYVPRDDVVLCWETFSEAAEDAGISRLYGGIHIRADHTAGKAIGQGVGEAVFEKAKSLVRKF